VIRTDVDAFAFAARDAAHLLAANDGVGGFDETHLLNQLFHLHDTDAYHNRMTIQKRSETAQTSDRPKLRVYFGFFAFGGERRRQAQFGGELERFANGQIAQKDICHPHTFTHSHTADFRRSATAARSNCSSLPSVQ
jgi:hypothetical protein